MIRLALLALLTPLLTGCFIFTNIQGRGTVTSVPPGNIACTNNGGACLKEYTQPGRETLKAEAGPGHTFARWSNCPYKTIDECQTLPWNQDLANADDVYAITATFKPKDPPVQAAQYTYNALGQRMTKKVGSTVTIFQYDLEGNLIAELDSTGQPVRQHIHVNGEPVAQLTTNPADGKLSVQYVHADHLGTPTLLTSPSGQVIADIEAEPFGETYIDYAEVTYNRRFPGQYKDEETGLHYNYFRDYDPTTGRYIQSDPIGIYGGLNTYGYGSANPLSYSDLYGLATYMCMQPLHALGGTGGKSGPDIGANPFYHQFIAIIHLDGSVSTGGQDRAAGPWGPGKPSSGDAYDAVNLRCEEKEPDNQCIEQCLMTQFNAPRPDYALFGGSIFGGQQCQQWADATLDRCRKNCE
jgi:RHS repeat-associated protein